jgi:hypothetical protein
MKKIFVSTARIALSALTALALMSTNSFAENLVVNGNFESFAGGYNGDPSQVEDLSRNLTGPGYTILTGWTNTAYTFDFAAGKGDTTGSYSQEYSVGLSLWGANNGGIDTLPASSPNGGNYIAIDPIYQNGSLSQSISGLSVGEQYVVNFDWAGAQQHGFDGATWEGFQVNLGNEIHYTTGDGVHSAYTIENASHGFTGWQHSALTFTAASATETLSFIALGGPNGVPPFALLDGVSLTNTVPEPSTMILTAFGAAGMALLSLRRRFQRKAA